LVMGKPMANGFPMSAVICTEEIAESIKNMGMSFFSTFGGNPLAVTALETVLDVI
jgi:ethanolamine-phosphate phospho-lyase